MSLLSVRIPRFLAAVLFIGTAWAQNNQADPAGYRIGPGDALDIRVNRHEDLSGKLIVGSDGTVGLPYINAVRVSGLTPAQAKERIEALLRDGWLRRPQVSVNLAEFAKSTYTVGGQVKTPGAIVVARNKAMTLTAAIARAGGVTDRASLRDVTLTRGGKVYTVNLKLIYANPSQDQPLKDGDVLHVRESKF